MANDSKEVREFINATAAVDQTQRGQNPTHEPFSLYAETPKLQFSILDRSLPVKQFVPGVTFDAFHLGPAIATRNALNRAFLNGKLAVLKSGEHTVLVAHEEGRK